MSGGRLARAWRRRWVRATAMFVALVLILTAAGGGWLAWRYSQVGRKHVASLADGERGEPENFLIVGSDSRAFVDGTAEATAYGTEDEVGEPHADTILLVRTFPDLDRVAMLSFPRDLWLPIAGTDGEDRINVAVQGGAARLVETVSANFGIPIHHYAQIDFRGFKGLVDAVDGVDVYFPAPARDFDPAEGRTLTGLDIPNSGCVRLNGDQALAYVRSRHFQQFVDGAWQADAAGDLNRIQRQQDFIRRTFHQSLSKGLLDPRRVDRLLGVAIRNVTLDQRLGLGDVQSLGRQFRSLRSDALHSYSLPTTPGTTPGGAQVLFLDEDGAEPVLDVFRGRTIEPPTVLAGAVRLRVENGSGRIGEVRAAAYRLAAGGFTIAGIGDAPAAMPRTVLRYGAGQDKAAQLIAVRLVAPPEVVSEPGLQGVDAVLVIGRDWQGVTESSPPSPTTTPPPQEASTTTATSTSTSAPEPAAEQDGAAPC